MSAVPGSGDFLLVLVQLLAIAALVDAARRLVAALVPPLETGDRIVATATVAGASGVALVQLLGFTGALRADVLAAAVAACWVATRLGVRSAAVRPTASGRRIDFRLGLVLGAAGVVLVAQALDALLVVPTEWDGLTYHLLYPARFLQEGRITPVEFGQPLDQAALYPANGELLHAFLMAFVRSDLLVALGMVSWTVLFGVAVAGVARSLGTSPLAAAAAGALAATLPALSARASSSYVEPLLDFALLALVLFTVRALNDAPNALRWSALAGVAAGLAVGTKYVALPLAATLALALPVALWLGGASRRRAAAAGLAYLGASAAIGGAWYLRNALLVGNPVFPAPLPGLPHLERPSLVWEGSSVSERFLELAADGSLTAALFGLPPRGALWMSLGPLALAAAILGPIAGWRAVADSRRAWRAGERSRALATLVVPSALLVLVATWARLPYWDNPGLFRSEVRFAVPAAALAVALAILELERRRIPARALAWVAAIGVVGQAVLAELARTLPQIARGALLVVLPLSLAALLAFPGGRPKARALVARSGALLLAAIALFAAWSYREASRAGTWLAPDAVFGPFARAALAVERAAPATGTIAFASSSHFEFLALFQGRRLERRVVAVPVHEGPREAFRYREGDARRAFDRDYWRRELERSGAGVLVVSRWQAWRDRWPPEHDWAAELQLEELHRSSTVAVFRVPIPAQGSRGGPQPDSQPRAP